ncbi:MAG: CYTH domain-containing protein [Thermodesulfobacteriota bacterium]|nr:CYTH domain-containing protein [Thermodesulfobacteriota bacterium]
MPVEIEKKFLVKGDSWRNLATGSFYCQGYISLAPERIVRVRTIEDKGFLTIKGVTKGFSRAEYEYEIPLHDANEMLDQLCERPLIEKNRYKIEYKGLIWEVDDFLGDNQGLILAEVELIEENQKIALPGWIGEEVTGNFRYCNASLVKYPFNQWPKGTG